MITVKDTLKNTKSGTPYKFLDMKTGADITQKVVFNLTSYSEKVILKMIMIDNKIFYFI